MGALLRDLKYAVRMLRDRPGFSAVIVLTLALGIGANTTIFSTLNAVLLRPLPWDEADRLVLVWGTDVERGSHRGQVSATDLADWRRQARSLEDIAAFSSWRPVLSGVGEAERVGAAQVGDGFLELLRARALHGRLLQPEDQEPGNDRVVVLSHGLWQTRFGGDPEIVGTDIRLNLVPYTVVGILSGDSASLPRGLLAETAELYRPLAEPFDESQRAARHVRAVARLAPAVELATAQAEMDTIAARIAGEHPDSNAGYGTNVVPLREDLVGSVRPTLLLLLGAVAFVLLTACLNVANLLLARGTGRRREMAIRRAIGAGRARIVRQLLTESTLLALLGGAAGVWLAAWSLDLIRVLGSRVHPALATVRIEPLVLAFALGVSMLSALVFGLAPAWQASGADIEQELRSATGGRGASGRRGMRDVLVVVEMTLAVVLLAGAGLLMRSVAGLYAVDPGFDKSDKIVMDVWLPWKKYREDAQQLAFFRQALDRVRGLPGVRDAGVVSVLPLGGNSDSVGIEVEGRVYPAGRNPSPDRYVVSPGYLRSMPIRLSRGRLLDGTDVAGTDNVVLVSETLARTIWPGEDPLGRRIRLPARPGTTEPWRRIVGVTRDVLQRGLDEPGTMQIYLPLEQYPWPYMTLVVASDADPARLDRTVRAELRSLDDVLPVFNTAVLESLVADSFAIRRFAMWLLAAFSAIALTLAATGIYGVLAYAVAQRTREIGVRMALGARARDVLRLVLERGALLTAGGLGLGLVTAWGLTRTLRRLLFAVEPTDPGTFLSVAGLLGLVALAACWVPARRASRVDPLVSLRQD